MREEWQFGAAKLTRFEVLFHESAEHRREPFGAKREQGGRRGAGRRLSECGRFAECELSL